MTVYTPPRAPAPQSSTIKPRSVVAVSESPFTYEQQAQAATGQGWQIEITLPPMKRAKAAPWLAFFLRINGREHTFTMGDSDARRPLGVATGAPVVDGAGQSGTALVTRGWTPDTPGILLAGSYVQIGTRLFMTTADADSDATGAATLSIWPRIGNVAGRAAPADGAPLILENTVGLWRLDEMPEWPSDAASFYTLSFTATEAL